jgi:hypothetical protein
MVHLSRKTPTCEIARVNDSCSKSQNMNFHSHAILNFQSAYWKGKTKRKCIRFHSPHYPWSLSNPHPLMPWWWNGSSAGHRQWWHIHKQAIFWWHLIRYRKLVSKFFMNNRSCTLWRAIPRSTTGLSCRNEDILKYISLFINKNANALSPTIDCFPTPSQQTIRSHIIVWQQTALETCRHFTRHQY